MQQPSLGVFACAVVFSASGGVCAHAQGTDDGLAITGAMRLRYEAISGQARVGFNKSDDLVNLRTNLLAQYRENDFEAAVC
jgi:hypothetical protein